MEAAQKKDHLDETINKMNAGVFLAAETLTHACHGAAKRSGWWNHPVSGEDVRQNPLHFPAMLMKVNTELSEACEGDSKKIMDDKLPHRAMREVELADAVIRIFDLAGGYGLDIAGAIVEKLAYNASRADHKPENRRAEGGKSY